MNVKKETLLVIVDPGALQPGYLEVEFLRVGDSYEFFTFSVLLTVVEGSAVAFAICVTYFGLTVKAPTENCLSKGESLVNATVLKDLSTKTSDVFCSFEPHSYEIISIVEPLTDFELIDLRLKLIGNAWVLTFDLLVNLECV